MSTYTVDSSVKLGDEVLASSSEAIVSDDVSVRRLTLAAGEELSFEAGSVATIIQVDISAGNKIQLTMTVGSQTATYDLYSFMRLPAVGSLKIKNTLTVSVDAVIVVID